MSEPHNVIPPELTIIKQELLAGQTPKNTPRALMGWFGFFRRGTSAAAIVRSTLDELGITTRPDFEAAYFDDGNMTFMLKETVASTAAAALAKQIEMDTAISSTAAAALAKQIETNTAVPSAAAAALAKQIETNTAVSSLAKQIKTNTSVHNTAAAAFAKQLKAMTAVHDTAAFAKQLKAMTAVHDTAAFAKQLKAMTAVHDTAAFAKQLKAMTAVHDTAAAPLAWQFETVHNTSAATLAKQTETISNTAALAKQIETISNTAALAKLMESISAGPNMTTIGRLKETVARYDGNMAFDRNGEFARHDGNMTFILKQTAAPDAAAESENKLALPVSQEVSQGQGEEGEPSVAQVVAVASVDPPMMLSRLRATTQEPVVVKPEDSIETAVTLMLINKFSQLPVFNNNKKGLMASALKGMISWRTIGQRLALGLKGAKVADFMEPPPVVLDDKASIFNAIDKIIVNDCILYQKDHMIEGIITPFDLVMHFGVLLAPFVWVGELERLLRALLGKHFSLDELREFVDGDDARRKRLNSAADLTFGEYIRCLENEANWQRLKLQGIDRKTFVADLHEIRGIRNEVMHFNTDSVGDDPILRNTVELLRKLKDLGVIEI